jgi:hypothetical protein
MAAPYIRPLSPRALEGFRRPADPIGMRAALAGLLAAGACSIAFVPAASADVVPPRSAPAFRDSVGVVTHIVYYDTAYGDWDRVVARLDELGVRHLREGIYANPTPQWRDWNERYYQAVELAAAHGIRFTFGLNPPGRGTGTVDQLLRVIGGRLRTAAEALEAPNEMDKYVGGPTWPSVLSAYGRELHRKAKASRSLRSLPILGPSFATPEGPQLVGDQRAWLDVGNIHPYTGGLSPHPKYVKAELARAGVTAPNKPVWATEAGFHNAMRSPETAQAPVSEATGAVYLLRTFLEHFRDGIRRTYAYELLDEMPDPGGREAEQHFGLLRHDFSRKPAYIALRNMLTVVGRERGRPSLRPLRIEVSAPEGDVRRLVLQKADGSYVVALWRLASVWDRDRRHPLDVTPRSLTVRLPGARRVDVADPIRSARERGLRLRRGTTHVRLGARPLLLHVFPR